MCIRESDIRIIMTKGEWGKIRAYFDVNFIGMSIPFNLTIKGCRLIQGTDSLFVSPPSVKKTISGDESTNGSETKYENIVIFGDEVKHDVLRAALAEYNGENQEKVEEKSMEGVIKDDLPF